MFLNIIKLYSTKFLIKGTYLQFFFKRSILNYKHNFFKKINQFIIIKKIKIFIEINCQDLNLTILIFIKINKLV